MPTLQQRLLPSRHAAVHAEFARRVLPTPLPSPRLAIVNTALAASLGIDAPTADAVDTVALLAGNAGGEAAATVYAGHQFGVWVPQLGDGRALLLGEIDSADGPQEIQLKGAGQTPYSRMGDGRAVLRSSIREYLCSEAMHGLGIPTTRALSMVTSPARVRREQMETTAVVARVSPSFIRFGHFEFFAHHGRLEALRALADYVIDRHFPACRAHADPVLALFGEVVARTATLMADWQVVGFCHGVMNTDNMSILGLTLDYGPFGFLDGFDAGHICNHSDPSGRYAWDRQPGIGQWNLACLASALLPLTGQAGLEAALARYTGLFETALAARFAAKLGLADWQDERDWPLLTALLEQMNAERTDWTLFWRRLGDFAAQRNEAVRDLFVDRERFDRWAADYRRRLHGDAAARGRAMQAVNPRIVLRNWMAEAAIRAAEQEDFSLMAALAAALARPYADGIGDEAWAGLPPDWADGLSVSCSS